MTGSQDCPIGERLMHIDAETRITPESTAELRAHLESCASCRARFAGELALREALAHVPPASPPAWRPPRSSWRWALPAAAAAILLLLVRFPAPPTPPTSIAQTSGAPIVAVFQQVERRFRLGSDDVEPYVITTTYHSVITCKP